MAQVELRNVKKSYVKGVDTIKDVSVTINDGEFMVLVGPSGSGKSTLLRMIAGLETISGGEILIDNKVVNGLHPKDRDIAMVFQDYALYPHMSVYENMAFSLMSQKYSKEVIHQRVMETAEVLDLRDYLKRKPKALSGGQRQRVALGRAIVRKPKVFLFDEPLSNLDAKLRTQMRLELKKLHAKLSTTIIYVTHDQTEAMTLGNRITVLDYGDIQQVDTPTNIYNHPQNKFVASFLGAPQINLFDSKVSQKDGEYFLENKSFFLQAPHRYNEVLSTVSNIFIGIRPEDLFEVKGGISGHSFKASVEVIETLGSEIFLELSSSEGVVRMKVSDKSKILNFHGESKDEKILSFDPNLISLFNAQSGENLIKTNSL